MKTTNEQTLWEIQAYGAKKSEILESVQDSISFKLSGVGMVIASYLSDAQEVMQHGDDRALNDARQYINIAKMLMMEFELGFTPR
jgi:tRNA threonylcarbamoyladenosine modification (KEOPS) complex Cgi121 subunit